MDYQEEALQTSQGVLQHATERYPRRSLQQIATNTTAPSGWGGSYSNSACSDANTRNSESMKP